MIKQEHIGNPLNLQKCGLKRQKTRENSTLDWYYKGGGYTLTYLKCVHTMAIKNN
jgi:hypothetical protein